MFGHSEPMDSNTRAILIGILGSVFLVVTLFVSLSFFITRSNERKIPAKIARLQTLNHMVDACKGLKNESAITLCLSQIPVP